MNEQKPSVLFSQQRIASRIAELGKQISEDYAGKDLILVPILKGSFVFASDLARAISLPLRIDFIGLRSYGNQTQSSGVVEITSDLSQPVANKDVIIVEDIVDTGLTMKYLRSNLKTRQPHSVKLATLLHKPSRTTEPVEIDYLGFEIEDHFVVGFGMDYAEMYRNLPYIGVLDQP